MNGARDQLLSRPGFALDQHVGLGRCHQIDLSQDLSQGLALADDTVDGNDLRRLFAKVVALQLQLFVQPLDLLERSTIPDGDGSMRRERGKPPEHSLMRRRAEITREHAHDAAAKVQWVAHDTPDRGAVG